MRVGKPGKWWVLLFDGAMFWTGAMGEFSIDGEKRSMPVYSMNKNNAQQFADRPTAVFTASIFGIADQVEPAKLEFVE